MPFSRLSGYLVSAFLIGIILHSLSPYTLLSHAWLQAAMIITVTMATVLYRDQSLHTDKNTLYLIPLITCFIFLGLYRFSCAQPSLPRGLIFGNPKGLASTVAESHTANHLDPRYWLVRLHINLTKRANERFSPDEAALLTGILYGERALSKTAKADFRHAGLTHIIAVSGSNMTIIVVVVMRALSLFHLSRRQSFLVTVLAVGLFTLFVGASASVARAAIMGLMVELAPLVGRLIRPSRLLMLAAFIFTFWRPWALLFDPSFALSFLAMTGLLTFGRLLDQFFENHISSELLREIITSTLSATILTTPYSAWAFGSITLWGLPTGLIVLPLIPWTMGLGALAIVLPTTLPISKLIFIPASGCLAIIRAIARWPEQLKWGFLDKTYLPFYWCLVVYLMLMVAYKIIHSLQHFASPVSGRAQKKRTDVSCVNKENHPRKTSVSPS